MTNKTITMAWLYPDLMSTYGDHGNILALQRRLEWRDIEVKLIPISVGDSSDLLKKADLIFMGGAQDRQQTIVSKDFMQGKSDVLKEKVEDNTPGLYICGAYQFLGKYYKEADGTIIEGLGIIDIYTENPGINTPRLIGNLAFKSPALNNTLLIGFENHGGRTYLGKDVEPLGNVIRGSGNNGSDGTEGAVYKNTFCSYSHGPILPKNPILTDHILAIALEKKYGEKIILRNLDDSLEEQARDLIASRLNVAV
ncbi:MAG: cobalamin biosynthesis protein CobQ [Candidatus Levybacteria bacterium]|nr:cobalamin biosynthesis protein CobQ [Candidatus Levybacteria bacterium]